MTTNNAQHGKELAKIILAQAQNKPVSEDEVRSLVTDYFNSNQINEREKKVKIVQHALVVLHPDKGSLADLEQALLITRTIVNLKVQYQSIQESNNVRSQKNENEQRVFNRNLLGSAFENYQIEQLMDYIAHKNPSLLQWFKPQSKQSALNAPIQFVKSVTGHPFRTTKIDVLLVLLLKIALLEHVISLVHPDKTMSEVIESYITSQDNYPIECINEPLLWLMNEIIFDNTQPTSKNSHPETTISTVECPSFINILKTVFMYEHTVDIASLQNLLEQWKPDNYLPTVKTLLSQLIASSTENNEVHHYINSLVEIDGQSVFIIDERSNNLLFQFYQLENEFTDNASNSAQNGRFSSHLIHLETYRKSFIYAVNSSIPSLLFSAKFQLKNENETHPISNCTIGEFLINRLNLLNFLINQERHSKNLILEDPNFQPVLDACESLVLTYNTSMGVKVPYIHTVCSIRNNQNTDQKPRKTLGCRQDWVPKFMSPEITSILKTTMNIFNIRYDDGFKQYFVRHPNPYKELEELFVNCSAELKNSPESKALLLDFSDRAFKAAAPNLHEAFSNYVKQYIKVQTPPVELLDFAEGLALFREIKPSASNHAIGYKQPSVQNQLVPSSSIPQSFFYSNDDKEDTMNAITGYKRTLN
ncbi:MAG: hypothetical protein WC627_00320 [Legionella sp.]|jgi:hypothetical protein